MLISILKNVLKISNLENGTKQAKMSTNLKKTVKKKSIFFCVCSFIGEEKISLLKRLVLC